MFEYIKRPRYDYMQKQRRQIILAWTQWEYKNLLRAQSTDTRTRTDHIHESYLIEEMIGDENRRPC